MEQFKSNYLRKCTELSVEPITLILNLFSEREKHEGNDFHQSETLDLSGVSISLKACTALSAALADNQYFTKLILADAFLGDDGRTRD